MRTPAAAYSTGHSADSVAQTTVTERLPGPTDRVLTAYLIVAPLLYLAADAAYAARGWDDAGAGVMHVIAAIAFGFVVLRVASWLSRDSRLAAAILVTGLVGMAGDVAYGFDTIHQSLGDTALVDQQGAATLIKPLGLSSRSRSLVGRALTMMGHRWQGVLVVIAMVAWPVAHVMGRTVYGRRQNWEDSLGNRPRGRTYVWGGLGRPRPVGRACRDPS